jgi:geranylgeranyl diphosphate synthase type I/geranylgeranyl diphosphate synthase type II
MTGAAAMAPELAVHHARWTAFCHQAVRAVIDDCERDPGALLGLAADHYDHDALAQAVFAPLRSYVARGGKLLRPYLVCLCLEAHGRDPEAHATEVALVEILHSASLILDDVADDSLLRRGGPTAHQALGVAVAGAAGMAWVNIGAHLVWRHRDRLGSQAALRLIHRLAHANLAAGLGQVIDVGWAAFHPREVTERQYLQGVVGRNSYTFRLAFEIATIAAGAGDEDVAAFGLFGETLGLAFQIADDVLNVRPRDARWGKVLAEDITEGKYSLPVLAALLHAAPADRVRLRAILDARTRDRALLDEATALLDASGAFDVCSRTAARILERATAQLDALRLTEPARRRMCALVDFLAQREL